MNNRTVIILLVAILLSSGLLRFILASNYGYPFDVAVFIINRDINLDNKSLLTTFLSIASLALWVLRMIRFLWAGKSKSIGNAT